MLQKTRPLILVRPESGWRELVLEEQLKCKNKYLRQREMLLRRYLFRHENIEDDWPENWIS